MSFNEPDSLIRLENVSKVFKTQAGDFSALKDINLSFEAGEFVSIMGKSGSGKSTLINMITGIDHPTSGTVYIGDARITGMKEGQLAVWRGRNLGVVFQFFQLLPTLSVLENTMLPMDLCHMYVPAERESRALDLLAMVGLKEEAEKLPAALSGGQQQIAAIARSLANDPPIIVADEPTGNLDSRTAEHILEIFASLAERGKTILIVTHDPSLAQHTRRQVLIADGELINEYVAQALPMLSYPEMLKVTKTVAQCSFEPGSTIAPDVERDSGLFLVTQGQVEVLSTGPKNTTQVLAKLQPGQHFSLLDPNEIREASLEYRAWLHGPVDVLWLSGKALKQLLSEAPKAASALRQAAFGRNLQALPIGLDSRESRLHV